MSPKGTPVESALGLRLLHRAETTLPDAYYRLARMVARVLVSKRLRDRRKWCDLVKNLAAREEVEDRLVRQAIHWLPQRGHGKDQPCYGKHHLR